MTKRAWVLPWLLLGGIAWGQTSKPPVLVCVGNAASTSCDEPASSTGPTLHIRMKPEPMDVPAIKVSPKIPWLTDANKFSTSICAGPADGDLSHWVCIDGASYDTRPKWSCADKSRILLTAEDNSRHCIKFPEAHP